jgi:spoIIIJ-associated protein
MEWVETTGRTIEEARDAALDMLGVDESDAEFVTLSEPRPGLFGRLRGEARVRARVMPTTPPPKRNRARRPPQRRGPANQRSERADEDESRQSGPTRSRSRSASATEDSDEETSPEDGASGPDTGRSRSSRRRRRPSGGAGSGAPVSVNGSESADGSADESDGEDGSNDRGGAPRDSSARRSQRSTRPRRQASSDSRPEEATVTETLSLEEQGDMAKEFIEGLVDQLGLEASVTAQPLNDETVQVAVEGAELGLLVGQGGATLAAIQELTRTVVQRKAGGHTDRILVDVAGYRAKRAEALGRFTTKVVEEVVASGREKALEAMSPADRKVVHDTVNELGGAVTRSEGVEPRRYVVISPVNDDAAGGGDVDLSDDAGEADDADDADEQVSEDEA